MKQLGSEMPQHQGKGGPAGTSETVTSQKAAVNIVALAVNPWHRHVPSKL